MNSQDRKSSIDSGIKEAIAALRSEIGELRQEIANSNAVAECPNPDDPLQLIAEGLRFLACGVEDLGSVGVPSQFVTELTRAMTLTGNGAGFERSVESAIREYREVHAEIRRLSKDESLPMAKRVDIAAGFKRILESSKVSLKVLGVRVVEVRSGTRFDPDRHEMVSQMAAVSFAQMQTVKECIEPGFEWRAACGTPRHKPARVSVHAGKRK